MDFIVQLPITKQGYDAIVVFVDRLTKRAHFCATKTTATAPDITKIFFENIFKNHGLPKVIVSDRDAKFTSNFWKAIFKQMGTKMALSTAFHPQTDGQTERMNRTLEEMLRIYATYQQNTWDEYLAAVEFAYNNSKQGSTGFTPFELDCGQHPHTPTTLATKTKVAAAEDFLNHWENIIKLAKDTLMLSQQRQSHYANKHRRDIEFNIGDKVLLSTKNIVNPIDRNRPKKKLTPKFVGPYKVIEKISHTAYKLDLPDNIKIHPVFHVSLLKLYKEEKEFTRKTPPPPVILPETNEEEYEVEEILDEKIIRNQPHYLVKWLGYPLHDATWEPLENLKNCQKKLNEFKEKLHQ